MKNFNMLNISSVGKFHPSVPVYTTGSKHYFEKDDVERNEDGGYTAFGIKRHEAYPLLQNHIHQIQPLLTPAIKAQLLKKKFTRYTINYGFSPPS